MPEGDTVRKLATRLQPLIAGKVLVRFAFAGRRTTPLPRQPVVTSVDTLGKHLLIGLDARLLLRVHLGLHGGLRTLGPDDPLPSERALSLLLQTDTHRIVGLRLRSVDLFGAGLRATHPSLAPLGPDLLRPPVPYDVVLDRLRTLQGARAASDVLLDQRVACGLGNVYQNELLFTFRVHPSRAAADVPDATWRALYTEGARQLTFNLDTRLRKTTFAEDGSPLRGVPRHWVYGRAGARCLRCGEGRIHAGRTREHARPLFWCGSCQGG